jgi:hypothetical protein
MVKWIILKGEREFICISYVLAADLLLKLICFFNSTVNSSQAKKKHRNHGGQLLALLSSSIVPLSPDSSSW